jgi:ectoine hydroxylase-related dioxygenase (phytanoyl-CoA dioxygenase family)
MTMDHRLSDAERDAMVRDGFVIRERVFDADECAAITAACEALVDELVTHRQAERTRYHIGSYTFDPDWLTGVTIKWEGDTDVVHGIEPFAHINEPLATWANDPRFVDPSKDFLGEDDVNLFTEKLNLKRPFVGGANPWHQDYPYWDGYADEPHNKVTAMLFLDDAALANGTLQVLPGSHALGRARTRTDKDAFGNNELDPTEAENKQPTPVEVPAGSVVWFGPFMIHKSEPNTSNRERRSLLFTYQPARCRTGLEVFKQQYEGRQAQTEA